MFYKFRDDYPTYLKISWSFCSVAIPLCLLVTFIIFQYLGWYISLLLHITYFGFYVGCRFLSLKSIYGIEETTNASERLKIRLISWLWCVRVWEMIYFTLLLEDKEMKKEKIKKLKDRVISKKTIQDFLGLTDKEVDEIKKKLKQKGAK